MKGFVVYPDSVNVDGKNFVRLFGRLENGESFVCVNSFEPYFFVLQKDVNKMKKFNGEFRVEAVKMKNFNEEKVSKIIFHNQTELNKFSTQLHENNIQTFESDIKSEYRFMMDSVS